MNPTFHEGEMIVQTRVGEGQYAEQNGMMVGTQVPPGAIRFLSLQSMAVLSSHTQDGEIWVTPLFGDPGFINGGDGTNVSFDLNQMDLDEVDPIWTNILHSPEVGMVVLEMKTRKRLRVNGKLSRKGRQLLLDVAEAYPNCPKYIQKRQDLRHERRRRTGAYNTEMGITLSAQAAAVVQNSDTTYVGSRHIERAASDASHRGGPKGFIQLLDEQTLRIPDYPGNSLFNTLGNLEVNPKAGLLVFDFEAGKMLQMTGEATIRWDLTGDNQATLGTGRLWDFRIARYRLSDLPEYLHWNLLEASPFNPNKVLG